MSDAMLFEQLRTGLCTFLGFPQALDPCAARGVVLGVPFDGGVIHRPGARFGPWAIRSASLGLGDWPMALRMQGREPSETGFPIRGWVDGGNIPSLPFGRDTVRQVRESVKAWGLAGCRTLILGGDHSVTLGALEAHARKHGTLGLLHFDAHPDAGDPAVWGTDLHHGTWLRTAISQGWVDPARTVQLGLRAPRHGTLELAFLAQAGVQQWTPLDLKDPRLVTELIGDIGRVGAGPAYLSLDMDVLDPAFAPAVAEPVPGGLSILELVTILQHVRRWSAPWVGADIMEVAPSLEGGEATARAAAHLGLHLLAAFES